MARQRLRRQRPRLQSRAVPRQRETIKERDTYDRRKTMRRHSTVQSSWAGGEPTVYPRGCVSAGHRAGVRSNIWAAKFFVVTIAPLFTDPNLYINRFSFLFCAAILMITEINQRPFGGVHLQFLQFRSSLFRLEIWIVDFEL